LGENIAIFQFILKKISPHFFTFCVYFQNVEIGLGNWSHLMQDPSWHACERRYVRKLKRKTLE
jgi:hypothetical protein